MLTERLETAGMKTPTELSKTYTLYEHVKGSAFKSTANGLRGLTVPGSIVGNEPAHNAHSQGATEFGIVLDKKVTFWGNNGNRTTGSEVVNYILQQNKTAEHREKETGYWCSGGTKIVPASLGVPGYVATIEGDDYVIYRFHFIGVDLLQLSTLDWNTIAQNGCDVERQVVSRDEYDKLTYAEHFKTRVTFGMGINLYQESRVTPIVKGIITNLNTSFSSHPTFEYWVQNLIPQKPVRVENTQMYFPTLDAKGNLISDVRKLPKIFENYKYGDATLSCYHIKPLQEGDAQYDEFIQKLEVMGGEIWQPYKRKPSSCLTHIWNHKTVHLYSEYHEMMQPVIYNYHNFHWVLEEGSLEFGVLKNLMQDEVMLKKLAQKQKDYIDDNNLQHKGNKLEPKVMENMMQGTWDEKHALNANYIKSLQYICDDRLTPTQLKNKKNHKQTIIDTDGEKDWIISDTENELEWPMIILEGMLSNLDYPHTRQLFYQTATMRPEYGVALFEGNPNSSKNKNKRDSYMNALNGAEKWKNLKKVWFVDIDDFKRGRTHKFESITYKDCQALNPI